MSVPYRPQLWWQVSFNADPNDSGAVPLWTDLTALVRKVGANHRGRVYELAQSTAGAPMVTFRDPSELLNPANTSSVYAPNVEPYRQILGQAMWPNEGTGNLINSGRWKANNAVAPDPSFESYANGAALPAWLTAVGATVPTVTTTNPQQGTKSLTYAVAATTPRQGVSWVADCVPGQQYTTSAYVRQSSASTQGLLVGGQTLGYDNFGRTASNGWGTADGGGAWSVTGTAGDYSVSGGLGRQSNSTTNTYRIATLPVAAVDFNAVVKLAAPAVAVGASMRSGLAVRRVDANNYYIASALFNTDSTITILLTRVNAGVATTVTSVTAPFIYVTGTTLWLRVFAEGSTLRVRTWLDGKFEPLTWNIDTTDSSITAAGDMACQSRLDTGNTNGTTVFTFDSLMVSGATLSTTTTTTGSYVRLSKTFTATQPQHTITMGTQGTGVAGTINVDAIQHEPGASANTFTTSGPVIYPLMRNYAERWTREYDAAGFVGLAPVPAVDGFAALNATSIRTEYPQTVLSLSPSYYWPLAGDSNTLQAPDISGNGGSPLVQYDSKYGPGNAPVFGTALAVTGDPGGTGVRFKPTAGTGVSILSLGRSAAVPGIAFPGAYYSGWEASISCWVQGFSVTGFPIAFPLASTAPLFTIPVGLVHTSGAIAATVQSSANSLLAYEAGTTLANFLPHHLVGTVTQVVGGNTTVKLYIDGVLASTAVDTTVNVGILSAQADKLNVGGDQNGPVLDGVISHVALWNRVLTAAEVTTLWTAGGLGYSGETTGTRWARHLTLGRYAGTSRISTGSTLLEPATQAGFNDLLSDGQQLALAELGAHWMAPDGADVFEGRQDRWLRLTSLATLGENSAGGESPYLDGVTFDYDPTFVYASVAITRNGGAVARGGAANDIAAVTRKFFGRSYAIGADFLNDIIAQYYADFVFNTHKAPIQRVSRITLDPSANPALWPVALSLEIGQRITVVRRAKAANSGAGITMSAPYFIEAVDHSEVDMDRGRWTVSFLLSPIGLGPAVTLQPWILEDTTYGVLDSTTVLGW